MRRMGDSNERHLLRSELCAGSEELMAYKHSNGLVFGNWDRFHDGHKAALQKAFELCETVLVVYTKALYHVQQSQETWGIEDIDFRRSVVESHIDGVICAGGRVSYAVYDNLSDFLADVTSHDFDAVIVSDKDCGNCWARTYPGKVQDLISAGKSEPILESVDVVYMADGQALSSSKLRKREKLGMPLGI